MLAPALPAGPDGGGGLAVAPRGFLLLRWPGTKLEATMAPRGRRDSFMALGGEVILGGKTGVSVSVGQAASARRNWPVSLHSCGEIP